MKGLAEIDHVQTTLADLNRQFTAMADERQAAYESAAIRLRDDIVNLLNMSATFPIPAYRPDDDAQSYRALKRSIATVVNCALALLEASLSDDQNGAAPKNKGAARLRKRVRAMAARTRDPDKLFAEASLSLRPDLIEQIRKLRNEAAAYQQTNTAVIPTRSRLIAALSDVLSGPADISSILAKMNGAISRDELLRELLQLHEHGVVRLVIDLPEHGNA
jgi:hypothetical protein